MSVMVDEMSMEMGRARQVNIEYDGFLTRLDLDEVLTSIDGIIEFYLNNDLGVDLPDTLPDPKLSFLAITGIEAGSITLLVIFGTAAATYVASQFGKGVKQSRLDREIRRSGKITGDWLKIEQPILNWRNIPIQRVP